MMRPYIVVVNPRTGGLNYAINMAVVIVIFFDCSIITETQP
jgi:hypothetical protein